MENEKVRRTRAEWIALIDACERSGLGRREFAEREGLHERTFAWWAAKLAPSGAKRGRPRRDPPFVPVVSIGVSEPKASTARVPLGASPVEIVLGNGRVLRCDLEQASDERLVLLIALTERMPAC